MENNQKNLQGKELSLNLPEEVAKGSYANLAIITHSTSEFIIDFARILPGIPKPPVTNRIIMYICTTTSLSIRRSVDI